MRHHMAPRAQWSTPRSSPPFAAVEREEVKAAFVRSVIARCMSPSERRQIRYYARRAKAEDGLRAMILRNFLKSRLLPSRHPDGFWLLDYFVQVFDFAGTAGWIRTTDLLIHSLWSRHSACFFEYDYPYKSGLFVALPCQALPLV